MAFCFALHIKTNSQVGGLFFINEVEKCIGKAKLGIGVSARRGDARIADQGIISPENQGKGIEQKEFLLHATKVTNAHIACAVFR